MWDNSARRKRKAFILKDSTPEQYERWLQETVNRARPDAEGRKWVFINAWNEWGEGAYLEPDQLSGRAYLEMTKQVLARHTSSTVIINSENSVQPALEIGAGKKQVTATAASVGDAPLLSVCMPIYNGNKFLEEAIRSVIDQTFKDFELVIVDDCSTEDPAPI